jgi:hypothetical protein
MDPTFDPKQLEAEAFGVVWEKPMTAVVRFSAKQAPFVYEREWHPTQKIRIVRGGRVELTFRAGGAFEIMRRALGWGDAEVVRSVALSEASAGSGASEALSIWRSHEPEPLRVRH